LRKCAATESGSLGLLFDVRRPEYSAARLPAVLVLWATAMTRSKRIWRVAAGALAVGGMAALAYLWRGGPQACLDDDVDQELEDAVDEALEESFPASDPPAWTLGGSRGR
jgi:hypothetical protein